MTRTKADWRRVLLAARTAADPALRSERNLALVNRVAGLAWFDSVSSLFGYIAIGAEADPRSLLERSAASTILVPATTVAGEDPRWLEWRSAESSEVADQWRSLDTVRFPAVAFVPGVGFDLTGMRLGRGRGFYDRALAALRNAGDVCAVGLAFECQIVAELPGDPWDQRMDYIVSERRVIAVSAALRGHALAGSR